MILPRLATRLSPLVRLSGPIHVSNPLPQVACQLQPVRTYIKNFYEEGTAVKPAAGWMHKQGGHFEHRWPDKRRINFKLPNEARRIRLKSYETLMKTTGGREILMKRILYGKDVISH